MSNYESNLQARGVAVAAEVRTRSEAEILNATLEGDGHDMMRAHRAITTGNLPAVLTEILEEVAIVVRDHLEVELTTRQLRGPAEGALSGVFLGDAALE